ncbi:hypothetical protein JTB14_028997 [Gonioctena quinquepunctata]|nr:hypothetical protein JTB14_028997 [Gonioctena quinquepunctata]
MRMLSIDLGVNGKRKLPRIDANKLNDRRWDEKGDRKRRIHKKQRSELQAVTELKGRKCGISSETDENTMRRRRYNNQPAPTEI